MQTMGIVGQIQAMVAGKPCGVRKAPCCKGVGLRAVRTLLMERQGRLLAMVLAVLILGIPCAAKANTSMLAATNRDALIGQPLELTTIIICPEIVVAGDELKRAILDPQWFLAEYRHQWSYINHLNSTLLTTPACEGDDRGYRCRGCKSVNATYYECPHTSMNPNDPCGRQRFGDGQEREYRGICNKIDIKGKTCKVSDEGINDCRVKTREPRRNPATGEQEEGTVFRSAYILPEGQECHESSTGLYTRELWYGCPVCNNVFNVNMRCIANDNSKQLCELASRDRRRRIDVREPIVGPVMECVDDCNPSGGNNEGGKRRKDDRRRIPE